MEAGEVTSSHSILMKKTPTEMQTRPQLAACPSSFHLGPSSFQLGSPSFQLGSCRDAVIHPLPPLQHPRVDWLERHPKSQAWDAQGAGHCRGWAAGMARKGMGSSTREEERESAQISRRQFYPHLLIPHAPPREANGKGGRVWSFRGENRGEIAPRAARP